MLSKVFPRDALCAYVDHDTCRVQVGLPMGCGVLKMKLPKLPGCTTTLQYLLIFVFETAVAAVLGSSIPDRRNAKCLARKAHAVGVATSSVAGATPDWLLAVAQVSWLHEASY